MAEIRAFQGFRYNPSVIKDISQVIAPPYDVISQEQKKEYYAKSPWNILRLDLPEGEDPYSAAEMLSQQWIRKQILVRDRKPCIYYYHQSFRAPDGKRRTRKGFLALIRLEEFDRGIVLPHETTLSGPKEDRLQLLRTTRTNLSPIFSLYSDPEQQIESNLDRFAGGPPDAEAANDGILHSLWVISDPETIRTVQQRLQPLWVLIADGHHRYESCLLYRNERLQNQPDPDAPFNFTLMFFCNINHPGILVLPYNRAVFNLPNFDNAAILKKASLYLELQEFDTREAAMAALDKEGTNRTAFLALFQNSPNFYLWKLRPDVDLQRFYPAETPAIVQNLDVNVLHKVFLQEILSITEDDIRRQKYLKYYKDAKEEWNDFESGKLQIAFFLNPTRIEQVVEVSQAGKKMPQKSTFFYPKLMNGFVINRFDQDEE